MQYKLGPERLTWLEYLNVQRLPVILPDLQQYPSTLELIIEGRELCMFLFKMVVKLPKLDYTQSQSIVFFQHSFWNVT